MGKLSTLRPFVYKGSAEYPDGLYDGHDLRLADMSTIYSAGRTPEEAIRALCDARLGVLDGEMTPLPSRADSAYDWGFHFTADGTSYKAAGINVPGGVVLAWWK